jgi:ABC-type transporter Mla subunit MlaD
MNTLNEDLFERLQDRNRHLATFLAAAEQAADEAAALVRQINEEDRSEVRAHYDQLADAEEKLEDVREKLGRMMGELEEILLPDEDDA